MRHPARVTLAALATIACLPTLAVAGSPRPDPVFETVPQRVNVGEPQMASNPKDTRNLVFETADGISVSHDGGRTWHVTGDTVADPVVVADKDGRFFVHSPGTGLSLNVETSTDGGEHWNTPTAAFSAAGQHPTIVPPSQNSFLAFDRPWLAVDSSDGTVYGSVAAHVEPPGGGLSPTALAGIPLCQTNVFATFIWDCGRRYVAASHDHGKTWGTPFPIDSPDYPDSLTGGFGGIPTASDGAFATFYYASKAPQASCPCIVLAITRDDGKHWTRRVVAGAHPFVSAGVQSFQDHGPIALLIADSQSVVFGPYGAADPAHPGRYAVTFADKPRKRLLVFETSDSGRTWSGPAVIGNDVTSDKNRPWLTFSPTGALGAYWLSFDGPGEASTSPFEAWVQVSRSGGLQFDPAVRLSHKPAVGFSASSNDNNFVFMDDQYIYGAWGDTRQDNQLEPWLGRYRYAGTAPRATREDRASTGPSGSGRGLAATGVDEGLAMTGFVLLLASFGAVARRRHGLR